MKQENPDFEAELNKLTESIKIIRDEEFEHLDIAASGSKQVLLLIKGAYE